MSTVSTNLIASQQITVLTFSGQSKFSENYQQILQKSVQADSITLSGLDDSRNTAQSRLTAIQDLDSTFATLQQTVTYLTSTLGDDALAVSATNSSLASYSLGTGAIPGTYQLEVTDLGAATQSLSSSTNTKVTNPYTQNIDSATSFQLTVTDPDSNGGAAQTTTINNPTGTLSGLVNVINAQPQLGVTASIVNVGSQTSPDYRLSLSSTSLGQVNIGLSSANAASLVSTTSLGHNSSYLVNGVSVSGTSDTVEITPGLTANLQQASPGNPTTVTVAQSTTQAATALQYFASAYNAVVDKLASQHGTNAGALAGDSLLQSAQQVLSTINRFTSSGSGLDKIGLDLGTDGKLTFSSSKFQAGLGKNFAQLAQFMGDKTTGFIGTATTSVGGMENSTTGILKNTEKSLTATLSKLDRKIADQIADINNFQNKLLETLAKSDALVYSISSQANFLQQMYLQMSANLTGGVA